MFVVHFFENNSIVLTQLLNHIPTLDGDIKIKGRKGKIISINKVEENIVHAYVTFEQIKPSKAKEVKKKNR
jgi:hypothetical protein